ncbi:MAG: glycosyl hydrolase [bacterium]
MKNVLSLILFVLFSFTLNAQDSPQVTTAQQKLESWNKRKANEKTSLIKNLKFRNIGPTVFSGRAVAVDVNPDDPTNFYVAFASGGLWHTANNGSTFEPLFQDQTAMTIGSIKVDWKNGETIWVGTGEANAFLFPGIGIYKSTDKGKSWIYLGLGESHSISRIVIHPDNPDVIWVGATGHLYTSNPERGVYKTTDGGKNWKQTLFVSDSAGVTDLIIDPNNPEILYAASWERYRRPWCRKKSGNGSGIYKSIDGGESWNKLNIDGSGFPNGDGIGRIGLTIYPKNSQILYAMLDNQSQKKEEKKEDEEPKLTKDQLRKITKDDFLKLDDKLLKAFLSGNDFPEKYSVEKVKEMVKNDEIKPIALVEYLEDANSVMFQDLKITGAEVYRSDDGGITWKRTHEKPLDNLIFTYGYVFDVIRVDPNNADKFYIAGVPILKSEDAGKTFISIEGDNVHVDHHALWVNPNKSGHLINCNDGGINMTYDDGKSWFKLNPMPVGQVYSLSYDMKEPYNVYAGFQDNGVWKGPSTYQYSNDWQQYGKYPYENVLGGDGFQIQVDFRDNNTLYTGYQYGNYYKIDLAKNDYKYIQPKHELGERPLRFTWHTPIYLSRHNQDILYLGSNKLFRSMNKGDEFKPISGDLSKGGRVGDVPYGTITAVHESPLKFGLIFVGTDDGLVHVTKDGGEEWENISAGLPGNYMISSIQASSKKEGRVYLSMTGFKWDNSEPRIYTSDDYGKTWKRIGTDLPFEATNVVYEDPKNENLIYTGTENGLYISLNRGESFMPVTTEQMPAVSVYDLEVHPRDNDLIVGTHGRSIYIADTEQLNELTKEVLDKTLHLFTIKERKYSSRWGSSYSLWSKPDVPDVELPFYTKDSSKVNVVITTSGELTLFEKEISADAGLNYFKYNLTVDEEAIKDYQKELNENKKEDEIEIKIKKADDGNIYLYKGTYDVILTSGDVKVSGNLVVK